MNKKDLIKGAIILATGFYTPVSVNAQTVNNTKTKQLKKEAKFDFDKQAADEKTFIIEPTENATDVPEVLQSNKINIVGNQSEHVQTVLKLKMTGNKRLHFSDGSIAWITYGFVNDSQREEPVRITLNTRDKITDRKLKIDVSVADDLNFGINKSGEAHTSLENIARNLQFAFDHDFDPRQEYDKHNLKVLRDGLDWRIKNAVKDLLKIKKGAEKIPGFVNNKYKIAPEIQRVSPTKNQGR